MPSAADGARHVGRRWRHGRRHQRGFTLIEVGLVISVLGLVAVLVSDFYITQLNLRYANQRADGAVRDMHAIINSALAWREQDLNGFWPHDANRITINQLRTDGFLPYIPDNRYAGCPGASACGGYSLAGWDRDAGANGDYTDDFMDADDLVVRVDVWGADHAHSIASQLPLGTASQHGTGAQRYRIEARLTYDGARDRFVHLRNEGRALAFGEVLDDMDEPLPLGDLRGVARIAWQRDVPTNADGTEENLYELDSDGGYERRITTTAGLRVPIVASPQGAEPEDTGAGITLAEDGVTVHGDLMVRPSGSRSASPQPTTWNVGEAYGQLLADYNSLAQRVCQLETTC